MKISEFRIQISEVFILGIRLIISGLFLYTGYVKAIDMETFASAIQGYQLLPEHLILPLSAILPWLEIWCAVALWIAPPFRKSAWIWISLMLLIFTFAKFSVMQRGIAISCGCSGSDALMTWGDVWKNGLWLSLAGLGLFYDRRYN